ncbi:MAG: ATP-binding protein [Magnetococcus sp. DMHC-6]
MMLFSLPESLSAQSFLEDSFFNGQMDYIYFIYGFSFILMGMITISLPREKDSHSWRLLGGFGLLHGIGEWLELLEMVSGDSQFFYTIRLTMHTVSFLFLVEFALHGLAIYRHRPYRPGWSLLALAFVGAGVWLFDDLPFSILSRYGLSFPACMVGAWLIWRGASATKGHHWLRLCAVALLGYGIASGLVVPPAKIWPASLLNTELFLSWTGMPIQLVKAMMAMFMAVALWGVSAVQADALPLFKKNKIYGYVFLATFLFLLGGGWALTETLGKHASIDHLHEMTNHLDSLVNHIGREVNAVDGGVIALSGIIHNLMEEQHSFQKNWQEIANMAVDQLAATVNGVAYLMDSNGVVLVSSNRDTPTSFVGKNFQFRPYFQQAMAGKNGHYFAFGSVSKIPGYYASAPIFSEDHQRVTGVAVIKNSLISEKLGFKQYGETFLINPDGVALLSSWKGFTPKPLWPLSKETLDTLEKSEQFGPLSGDPLFQKELTHGTNFFLSSQQYMVGRKTINMEGWSLLLLSHYITYNIHRFFCIFITLLISTLMLVTHVMLHRETIVLFKAKRMAEIVNQTKSHFIANVGHEIRTPMNVIIGFSYLVSQTQLNSQQQNYVQKIQSAADVLMRLINDILDFSKMESGKIQLERQEFALDKIFENVASITQINSAKKGITFTMDRCASIPPYLLGDARRLEHVLTNLLSNAVKFTQRGHISLKTTLAEESDAEVTLRFAIQDTGIGITSEVVDQLFQAFHQGDGSTTRSYSGTGLGLAISKQLVHAMGGEISVSSEVGVGSCFTFTARFGKSSLVRPEVTITMEQPSPEEPALLPPSHVEEEEITLFPAQLVPLFKKAIKQLQEFDSEVERVVEEIVPLVHGRGRQQKLESIKDALAKYDFEGCLANFCEWAKEEGLEVECSK